MCFSQGCDIAASLAIKHQNETPHEPLPFKGVFFICGGLPLYALEDIGLFVRPNFIS